MAADVKRWSVTYTKHVKQKRKVYQDGYLQLNASSNKLLLYDDCDKLMECRMLKRDEEVSSGETLTFNSFLVDVNDAVSADGDRKPIPGFNSQAKSVKFNDKRPKSFVNPMNKQQPSMSPSQKIIREFKNRELHKYGAAQCSPEPPKTSKTEWQALYTTQLTQKTKKYHDGFLQLAVSGSHAKQIVLLDASRKQLDSRFLKKDEVIESGESIGFDGHLVEIGEREGDHKPATDLHFKENKRNVVGEARIKQEQTSGLITSKDTAKDWHALYTTQITQKAKKYHGGILRLAFSDSYRQKVCLLDEHKTMLGSKYVSLSEDIRTGCMIQLPNYLVEVGTLKESSEGEGKSCCKDSLTKASDSHLNISNIEETKSSKGVPTNKPLRDAEPRVSTNKPLRDAHQILSILQKPMAQESKVSGHTDNSTARPVSSSNRSQVSDVMIVDSAEDDQPSQLARSFETIESIEKRALGIPPDLMSFKVFSDTDRQLASGIHSRNSTQLYSDHITQLDKAYTSGKSRLSSRVSDDAAVEKSSSSKEPTGEQSNDYPSFDLGF